MRKPFLFFTLAGIIGFQVLLPPIVGLANNGDFGKVVGIWGLGAPWELEFKYASAVYTFDSKYKYWGEYLSSEQALAAVAVTTNRLVSKDGRFDIRVIGVIHAALYIAIWYLAAPLSPRCRLARLATALLVVILFGDVFYAEVFNTFYMDAAALLGILAFSIGFLRACGGITPRASGLLALAGTVVLITSKMQHAPLGLCFLTALAASRIRRIFHLGIRGTAITAITLVLAIGTSLNSAPAAYRSFGVYDVIFWEILPNSDRVADRLSELGLDDSYRTYIGTHSFTPTSGMQNAEFAAAFSARVTNLRLLRFYLRHPALAFRILKKALNQAGRQRPPYGNFDPSAGRPEFSESSAFSLWSAAKRSLFENRAGRYLWTSLSLFAFTWISAIQLRSRFLGVEWLAALLSGMAFIEMLVAGLLDVLDVTRHFFLFSVLWDCVFLLLVLNFSHASDKLSETRFPPANEAPHAG